MIHERDYIVLTQDSPDDGLKAGDVGTVVHIPRDAAAYEVEFMTLTGRTSPSPRCFPLNCGRSAHGT
jgi:hypothetical protein